LQQGATRKQQQSKTMVKTGKILMFAGLAAAVAAVGVKGYSEVNKLKQALGTFNFSFAFVRIHGLIGEGITKFTNPTIRVIFNINLKNFTGYNIEINKIYARIETQKAGSNSWSVIATPGGYMDIKLADGGNIDKLIQFDFKGLGTITSLISKTNRHRVVMTYTFKGKSMPEYTTDLDLAGPIAAFWAKSKNAINALKGVEDLAL
jgi:hypothetical protein